MSVRFGGVKHHAVLASMAISCGIFGCIATAQSQETGRIGDSKAIAADAVGRATSADQPGSLTSSATPERGVTVAAVSPLHSTNIGGTVITKPWLAVVIQATLVEMGCEHVTINGQWDA